jgi:tetratricopeptide (TPR) repeat protein
VDLHRGRAERDGDMDARLIRMDASAHPMALASSTAIPLRAARVLAIALLAALPYLNGLEGEFVFDDVGAIRDNPVIQREPAWRVFTTVYEPGALYRPSTMLSYVANARLDGGPIGFHAVNVLLHVAVALAVYALAVQLLAAPTAAWIAAALFAVHPFHTEALTGIVGRAEILAALFALLSLLALARALPLAGRSRHAWLACSLLAFAVGMLAKESAFTTIGLVLVVHWRAAPADDWRRRVAVLAPYLAVGAAYLGLRLWVVGAMGLPVPPAALDNPLAHVDTATRVRTAVVVLWDYLAMLAPARLSADYSFNQVPLQLTWYSPRVWFAGILLTSLAATAVALWRRRPEIAVAAALFAIPLAFTANLLFPIGTIKAERLLYLPSVGACLIAGWLLAWWAEQRPRSAGLAVAAILAVLAARTWVRNDDWQDERTLYAAAVRVAPDSAKAHHNLAVALERAGAYDDAIAHYQRALTIYPDYAAAAFRIGHIATLRGDDETAMHWYLAALKGDDAFAKAHLQLGMIYQRRGDYPAAESAFTAGLATEPDNALLLVNLAAARLSQGNRWGARAALTRLDGAAPPADESTEKLVAAAGREIEVAVQ